MLHTWDNDVVVGVSIILDQGTAVVVASEFNGVRVDGVDRGQESFTFVHNHGSVGVNGGSGNLRIDMGANLHVTSDHGKFNSVGAQGSLDVDIFVHVVVHVLVHVVVIVVVIIVGFLVDVGDQIVVGVAIIGDKSATMIVAGDLELVGGNLVHRGSIGLAVNLDSDGLVVEGGGGQLRVGVGVHIDVSSVDVELHAVSAHGLWLSVHVIMHVRVAVHVGVTMVMVVMTVVVLVLVGNDVVMRIAIIGDQCATVIVAGELESMRINFVHWGDIGVSVDLNCDLSWGDGGSGVLGVGVGADRDVASSHMELHAVGAHGLVVIVTVVVVSVVVLLVVGVVVVLTVLIGVMLVGSWERVSER